MEAFSFKPTIGSINTCDAGLLVPSFSTPKKLSFYWKFKKVGIFACKDGGEVNGEDGMRFKVGKMLSDDPKLALSKVPLHSLYCLCLCELFVCVREREIDNLFGCVCERERERERAMEGKRERECDNLSVFVLFDMNF